MIHTLLTPLMLMALVFTPGARQELTPSPKQNTWTVQTTVQGDQSVPTKLNVVLHIHQIEPTLAIPRDSNSAWKGTDNPQWQLGLSQTLPQPDAHLYALILTLNKPDTGRPIAQGLRLVRSVVEGNVHLRILLPKRWSVPKTDNIHIQNQDTAFDTSPSIYTIPHGSFANPTLLAVNLPAVTATNARQRGSYVVEFTLVKSP